MLSTMASPYEWHYLQYVGYFCVIFILFSVCRAVFGCDFDDTVSAIHPLLKFYCMSLPLANRARPAHRQPTREAPKRKEESAVSECNKKKPLKEKKRKRKKSADKDCKDSIKMGERPDSGYPKQRPKLALFGEIKMKFCVEEPDFYRLFNRFVLTREQLVSNNFPLDCPQKPGYVILKGKVTPKDPTSRTCSRCRETFYIVNDKYESETTCCYHAVRCNNGYYECCNMPYKSEGCRRLKCHVTSELDLTEEVFKKAQRKKQVSEDKKNKVYALDCEMVFTTIGMEVVKVALVDAEGGSIYNALVLPKHTVLDYNTEFSGITEKDLARAIITLEDVQTVLQKHINKDTILVGHALQNDLRVLRFIHEKVVDTQVVFREGKNRRKLKVLAKEYLERSIQDSKKGHDSIEDARACMELMLWKIKSHLDNYVRRPEQQEILVPSFQQHQDMSEIRLDHDGYDQHKILTDDSGGFDEYTYNQWREKGYYNSISAVYGKIALPYTCTYCHSFQSIVYERLPNNKMKQLQPCHNCHNW